MAQGGVGKTKMHSFRPVEPGDLALIRRHRVEMFRAGRGHPGADGRTVRCCF